MTHRDDLDFDDVEIVDVPGIPRSGDVHGKAFDGHRVDRLWAVIVVQANGDEGLASFYTLDDNDHPTSRITLVASSDPIREEFEKLRSQIAPPEGGRLEWREFRNVSGATPNGYDPMWVAAINNVLADRDTGIVIEDIDDILWDRYIGPMIDELEEEESS